MKKIISILALVAFLFGFSVNTFATHTAGGELIYKKKANTTNTYTFYFKFYRNCANNGSAASTEPTSFVLCYTSPCTGTVQQVTMPKMVGNIPTIPPVPNGTTLSNGCEADTTSCEILTSQIPGYQQWWYSADVTLPVQCNDWRFWTGLCCRNLSIGNLGPNASDTYDLYVETHFDNLTATLAQENSSPYFLNSNSANSLPIPYMCVNTPYVHNGGALDPDGDSLVFEMISPRGTYACTSTASPDILWPLTTYNILNTGGNPLPCNNTFNLDQATGHFTLTPNTLGKYVLSLKCSEYRNGVLLGSIMRDMQVVVANCIPMPTTTVIDSANIVNGLSVQDTVKTCPNNLLDFCFDINSNSGVYLLSLFNNSATAFPGSTITINNVNDSILHVCMQWLPVVADSGYHTLFVNVKDSVNCLTNPAIVSVTIYVNKPQKSSNDTVICAGTTIKLGSSGNTGFTWDVLPGGSPISSLVCLTPKCDTVNVTPTVTTSYVVTDTVCNFKDTILVQVIYGPNLTISPDTTTCVNSSVQLNVDATSPTTNLFNYSWSPAGPLDNSTIKNPTANGALMSGQTTFTVTVTTQGILSCASTAQVTVDLLKGFDIVTPDTTICNGDQLQIITSGGNPKYTIAWTPTTFVSNPAILNPVINPSPMGVYPYTVTASYPGCPDTSQTLTITVEPIPVVDAGIDREICKGDTVHLLGTVLPASGTYTYQWSPASDLNNGTILNPSFDGVSTTVFTLTATTSVGCKGQDISVVNVLPVDFLFLNGDRSLCPNIPTTLTVGGGVSYLWSPANMVSDSTGTLVTVEPITTTVFYVYGVDNKGCKDTAHATVVINPNAVIDLGPSQTIYPGESAQLFANGNCNYFSFFPPNGLSATNTKDPIATPSVTTRYFVTAQTENGCSATDSVDVIVSPESIIEIANSFSPGPGTGLNDGLRIIVKGMAKLNSFKIFDRWGIEVFSTNDINQGWNGQYNGKPQPMGVYVYVIDAVSSATGKRFYKQGNVTLLR